ncbi:MAG TPA: arylsulfatase [Verrucomicrobiota bacterium]|nr:arylsulfatase [Verrucomicrobiota bacterium]HOP97452.1 arylsulfatase [Verrucomicrobiota bacterium]HPU55065.1 arylsulfatase [Verrucomicrobiota bacterium]
MQAILRHLLRLTVLLAVCSFGVFGFAADTASPSRPNVIFILADDLGYGDIGCYGQKRIRTPNIDRLAEQGMRFTQAYAGSTVCAPSRCSLMTGKHTGHATVRGNRGSRPKEMALTAEEPTIAEVFKAAGYSTALIGKWGVGENDTTGAANRKGFDLFFGYQTQFAAHDYYPGFLWRNNERYLLPGNEDGKQVTYSHDVLMKEALAYVRENRNRPFFLYLAVTIPHANNEAHPNGMQVPTNAPYANEDWPEPEKNFAAMITRMDDGVGSLLSLLQELGIDDRTLVIFTSDNGPHSEGGHRSEFFQSSGGLRGQKRDMYEGGIRVPLIARWPGRIKAGTVSDQIVAFWDFLPTFADLTGQPPPKDIDGISILPALLENKPVPHPPLYWEFHERGFFRAVRAGNWKGVSLDPAKPLELYDLSRDPAETNNVAAVHPEVVKELEAILRRERTPSEIWPTSIDAGQ